MRNNKFNIGFVVDNIDYNMLHHLEPWCDVIYTDFDTTQYYNNNKDKTCFNLMDRLLSIDDDKNNDFIIKFDCKKFSQGSFEILQNIQNILGEIKEPGIYEIDIFTINAATLQNRINDLIFIPKQ